MTKSELLLYLDSLPEDAEVLIGEYHSDEDGDVWTGTEVIMTAEVRDIVGRLTLILAAA